MSAIRIVLAIISLYSDGIGTIQHSFWRDAERCERRDDSAYSFDGISDVITVDGRPRLHRRERYKRLIDSNNTIFCYSICTAAMYNYNITYISLLLVCTFNYLVDLRVTTKVIDCLCLF